FFVKDFAYQTSRPDRFIGLHYFYHPAKNRLLEVVPHATTSRETIERALLAAKLHGKTAILVKDAPGFAVNRFFVPFLNEAARLLEEGAANIATIEEAAKRAFNIGMGAFELMNVTGIPIAVHSSHTLGNELGPFYATPAIMKAQMDKNEPWDLSGSVDTARLPTVIDRLYGACLGVAAALVDEGVATMEDTDRGAKIGLRWSRGPFEIMNEIGIERTYALVLAITKKYPDFKMPALLERQKNAGQPFVFSHVDLEEKGRIAYITINRPEAMNALNEAVFAQLEDRFAQAENNPEIMAIVFKGAGKTFIAGADIRYFVEKIRAGRIDDIIAFTRKGHELLLRIENSPKLTIAQMDGLSLGGGTEFALACQAIIATPACSMALPETGIGIYPGLGGMLRFTRQIGPELARYFTFTGATITAQDAAELGIVTALVEPGEMDQAVENLLTKGKPDKYRKRDVPVRFQAKAQLCSPENVDQLLAGKQPAGVEVELAARTLKSMSYKAPLAMKLADAIIDQQGGKSIPEAVEIELGSLQKIFSTGDALEGLSSLGSKKPEFKGK
ncbi:MAG: enoyl-CoA hydratase/isomerase family protein, partial [Deltaproteobacteria bacterium]|nr:enoyl-CoA hydratase/isomerase family protein [Deltaproteobacteria bacterium]